MLLQRTRVCRKWDLYLCLRSGLTRPIEHTYMLLLPLLTKVLLILTVHLLLQSCNMSLLMHTHTRTRMHRYIRGTLQQPGEVSTAMYFGTILGHHLAEGRFMYKIGFVKMCGQYLAMLKHQAAGLTHWGLNELIAILCTTFAIIWWMELQG